MEATDPYPDFIDESRFFKLELWEFHARKAASDVNKWFCWNRRKKMNKLLSLIRIGSACHEHGKVKDREKLGNILDEVEDVALKYL